MKADITHLIVSEEPDNMNMHTYWGTSACGKINVPGEVSPLLEGYPSIQWKYVTCKACMRTNIYKEIKFKHELGLGV